MILMYSVNSLNTRVINYYVRTALISFLVICILVRVEAVEAVEVWFEVTNDQN